MNKNYEINSQMMICYFHDDLWSPDSGVTSLYHASTMNSSRNGGPPIQLIVYSFKRLYSISQALNKLFVVVVVIAVIVVVAAVTAAAAIVVVDVDIVVVVVVAAVAGVVVIVAVVVVVVVAAVAGADGFVVIVAGVVVVAVVVVAGVVIVAVVVFDLEIKKLYCLWSFRRKISILHMSSTDVSKPATWKLLPLLKNADVII